MKICYIISTCDKYLDTRVSYQMETMFKNINKNDIYYLTSKSNEERRYFGWNTMDDTQNITWKYIHFIYNMCISDYDWYILIDDDTFVFHERLQTYLSSLNSKENYYIGCQLDHIKNDFCIYMSGGAGYAISNALYTLITEYIKKIGKNEAYYQIINLKEQFCDDLCIGLWIKELSKTNNINQLNNNFFHLGIHENDLQLLNAITFHKVIKKEQFDFYLAISEKDNKIIKKEDTVFALVTDAAYFAKAKRTIIDLRSKGNWRGPIALITIDFNLNANFADFYDILEVKFDTIDKTQILQLIGPNGFSNSDKRELNKLNQWEKLHIFDDFFAQWQRVIYLDAGMRVLDDVKYLLEVEYKDSIVAHQDGEILPHLEFRTQISHDNQELVAKLCAEYGSDILQSNHMLNCMWIYDTDILKICNKSQMIEAMNKWPLCKTNEMTIMNLLLHFKYKLWKKIPQKASNGKNLFDWSEVITSNNVTWRDYCLIKYPVTIKFDD
jgi:hypothetical protein